jgi:hypothetical protein
VELCPGCMGRRHEMDEVREPNRELSRKDGFPGVHGARSPWSLAARHPLSSISFSAHRYVSGQMAPPASTWPRPHRSEESEIQDRTVPSGLAKEAQEVNAVTVTRPGRQDRTLTDPAATVDEREVDR